MLRTDKFSAIVTCVFGTVIAGLAVVGLALVALQRGVASAAPPIAQGPSRASITEAIHGVWLIYFPFLIIGGIVYCIAGFYLLRGSSVARRVAQAITVCGYAWLIAYAASCYRVMDIMGPSFDPLPASMFAAIQWLSLILGILIGTAFLTGLLYILSRPPCH